jgi:glutathione peroxidase
MFTKTVVTGTDASPFYKQLAALTGKKPSWNFFKYLIGRDGKVVDTFGSMTNPSNRSVVSAIEKSLAVN